MTAAPAGAHKADAENADAVANAAALAAEEAKAAKKASKAKAVKADEAPIPEPAKPNDIVPEGSVEVTRKATEDEIKDPEVGTDPEGNISSIEKVTRAPRAKKDPLTTLTDHTKLPVAAHVGQVAVQVRAHNGNAVLTISLVGWVGEPEFQIRAEDVVELEDALASIRKQLA